MADNELKLHVSADTKSARDEFKQLGTEAQKAFNGLGEQGQIAAQRLAALDKAWDSPAKLGKAAALAKLEIDTLSGSLEKAGKLTPELARQFEVAGQKIDLATNRARQFADAAGDLKTKGDAAAKGFEAAAGAATSLEGILGRLKDTGSAFQGKLADIGFGLIGFSQALKLGLQTGEDFSNWLQKLGVDMKGFQKFNEDSIVETLKLVGVLKDAVPSYRALTDEARRTGEAHMEMSRRASDAIGRLTAAGSLKDWRLELQKTGQEIADWEEKMRKASAGGAHEFSRTVLFNQEALLKLRDRIRQAGVEFSDLEPPLARAIRAAERMAEAEGKAKKGAEELAESSRKLREALDFQMPDWNKWNEVGKIVGSFREVESALLSAKKALAPEDFDRYVKANEESLVRWGGILKRQGMEIPKLWKELLDGFDTSKWLDEQAAQWDKFRAIQRSAATDAQKPLRDLITAYNDLAAAQAAAFKAGDPTAVEELRARMSANLAAQAEATQKLAEAAREAGVALGALETVTVGNADAVERAIQQTLAWKAAQEDLNRAFREGEFRLQGINWEIRRAKETTVELSKAQEDFIEALARNSDANPQTQLWFGRMIWQLEEDMKKGKASFADFEKTIQEFFRAMSRLNMEVPGLIDLTKLNTQLMEVMRILEGYRNG